MIDSKEDLTLMMYHLYRFLLLVINNPEILKNKSFNMIEPYLVPIEDNIYELKMKIEILND